MKRTKSKPAAPAVEEDSYQSFCVGGFISTVATGLVVSFGCNPSVIRKAFHELQAKDQFWELLRDLTPGTVEAVGVVVGHELIKQKAKRKRSAAAKTETVN